MTSSNVFILISVCLQYIMITCIMGDLNIYIIYLLFKKIPFLPLLPILPFFFSCLFERISLTRQVRQGLPCLWSPGWSRTSVILLSQLLESWDYRYAPPHIAPPNLLSQKLYFHFFLQFFFFF